MAAEGVLDLAVPAGRNLEPLNQCAAAGVRWSSTAKAPISPSKMSAFYVSAGRGR